MTEDERIDAAIEYMADYLDNSDMVTGAKLEAVASIMAALMVDLDDEAIQMVLDNMEEAIKDERDNYEGVTLQ